tara:strand:- start:6834 stop:6986 length:153 start_codon:yes stop_codon:yes gene_type:complete
MAGSKADQKNCDAHCGLGDAFPRAFVAENQISLFMALWNFCFLFQTVMAF